MPEILFLIVSSHFWLSKSGAVFLQWPVNHGEHFSSVQFRFPLAIVFQVPLLLGLVLWWLQEGIDLRSKFGRRLLVNWFWALIFFAAVSLSEPRNGASDAKTMLGPGDHPKSAMGGLTIPGFRPTDLSRLAWALGTMGAKVGGAFDMAAVFQTKPTKPPKWLRRP